MTQDLPDVMGTWTATKMLLSHTFIKKIFIHTWYHFAISIHSHFVFKMPSPTNGSLELLTYPPLHKDIQTEVYSAGVPLIAERIFSLLSPADLCNCLQVCKPWNYQVSSVPEFMNKVYAH